MRYKSSRGKRRKPPGHSLRVMMLTLVDVAQEMNQTMQLSAKKQEADYADQVNVPILKEDLRDDPGSRLWSVYANIAKTEDDELAENWDKDMDVLLIYAGLFSAVVTAFIIEGYKNLQPNSSDGALILLDQISRQLAGAANGTAIAYVGMPIFQRQPTVIPYNVLWFLSLSFSLSCALGATLVKQWGRDYIQTIRSQNTISGRARVREFLYQGIKRWRVNVWIDSLVLVLHASVFLFFAGVAVWLSSQDQSVTWTVLGALIVTVSLYMVWTVAPLISCRNPFRTPLSVLLVVISRGLGNNVFPYLSAFKTSPPLEDKEKMGETPLFEQRPPSYPTDDAEVAPTKVIPAPPPHSKTTSRSDHVNRVSSSHDINVGLNRKQVQKKATKPGEQRDRQDRQALRRLIELLQYEGHWEALLGGIPSFVGHNDNRTIFEMLRTDNQNDIVVKEAKLLITETIEHAFIFVGDHQPQLASSVNRTRVALNALICFASRMHPSHFPSDKVPIDKLNKLLLDEDFEIWELAARTVALMSRFLKKAELLQPILFRIGTGIDASTPEARKKERTKSAAGAIVNALRLLPPSEDEWRDLLESFPWYLRNDPKVLISSVEVLHLEQKQTRTYTLLLDELVEGAVVLINCSHPDHAQNHRKQQIAVEALAFFTRNFALPHLPQIPVTTLLKPYDKLESDSLLSSTTAIMNILVGSKFNRCVYQKVEECRGSRDIDEKENRIKAGVRELKGSLRLSKLREDATFDTEFESLLRTVLDDQATLVDVLKSLEVSYNLWVAYRPAFLSSLAGILLFRAEELISGPEPEVFDSSISAVVHGLGRYIDEIFTSYRSSELYDDRDDISAVEESTSKPTANSQSEVYLLLDKHVRRGRAYMPATFQEWAISQFVYLLRHIGSARDDSRMVTKYWQENNMLLVTLESLKADMGNKHIAPGTQDTICEALEGIHMGVIEEYESSSSDNSSLTLVTREKETSRRLLEHAMTLLSKPDVIVSICLRMDSCDATFSDETVLSRIERWYSSEILEVEDSVILDLATKTNVTSDETRHLSCRMASLRVMIARCTLKAFMSAAMQEYESLSASRHPDLKDTKIEVLLEGSCQLWSSLQLDTWVANLSVEKLKPLRLSTDPKLSLLATCTSTLMTRHAYGFIFSFLLLNFNLRTQPPISKVLEDLDQPLRGICSHEQVSTSEVQNALNPRNPPPVDLLKSLRTMTAGCRRIVAIVAVCLASSFTVEEIGEQRWLGLGLCMTVYQLEDHRQTGDLHIAALGAWTQLLDGWKDDFMGLAEDERKLKLTKWKEGLRAQIAIDSLDRFVRHPSLLRPVARECPAVLRALNPLVADVEASYSAAPTSSKIILAALIQYCEEKKAILGTNVTQCVFRLAFHVH